MLIINPRSWKLPLQHNDTIVHASRYNYPIIRYNTPKDVNVIAHYPLLEFSTFRIGINMRQTLSLNRLTVFLPPVMLKPSVVHCHA